MKKVDNESLKQLRRDITLANNQRVIDRILKTVLEEVKAVKEIHQEVLNESKRIKNLPPGKKGDPGRDARGLPGQKGKDGQTPIKGVDYWTKQDEEYLIVKILQHIRQPKDGQDAVVDIPALVKAVIEEIRSGQSLAVGDIKGLRPEIDSYRNQLAMKQAGQHGGGTTVSAGTNITLTPLSNGTTRIDAAGGAGLSILSPVGAVDSANVTFVFTDDPVVIVRDGSTLREGFGYSYNSGTNTATLDIPPSFDLYGLK